MGIDRSETDEVIVTATPTLPQVRDNLAEIVKGLLDPLYERFNFTQLPATLVGEELLRLRENRM